MGYCIICGKNIPIDISMPFCNKCYSPIQNTKRSTRIDGRFCHYCKDKSESISNIEPRCRECVPLNRKDNSIDDYYLKKIDEFKNMSLIERQKITPLWSRSKNLIPDHYKNKSALKEIDITEVLEILETKEKLITSDVFNNEPQSNRRVMSILRAWKHGVTIEPPTIICSDPISISDGRHRSLAAQFVGAKTIPVYYKKK